MSEESNKSACLMPRSKDFLHYTGLGDDRGSAKVRSREPAQFGTHLDDFSPQKWKKCNGYIRYCIFVAR